MPSLFSDRPGKTLRTVDIVRLRLWIGRKLYGRFTDFGKVHRVSRKRVIKGPCYACEVEAMEFVRNNPDIPISKVYRVYRRNEWCWVEMELCLGQNIEKCWGLLDQDQRSNVIAQLAGYVRQMRALTCPYQPPRISSSYGHSVQDSRIGTRPFGPLHGVDQFHSLLRGHIDLEESRTTFGEHVMDIHTKDYRVL